MPLIPTLRRSVELGRLGVDMVRSGSRPEGPARDAARRLISARMGRMRGLPQKIGQLLSLGADGDNGPFGRLTDAAEPVPASEAFEWIAGEFGVPVRDVFRTLDAHGAAASLGQVHRGTLHDGRDVAVKVQYPGIRESLDADLAALGWLAAPLSARRSGFDLDDYRRELRCGVLAELDYRREVATLERFAARANEVPGLITPRPVAAWCTSRVITMSWLEGDRLAATEGWPAPARHELALVLLRFFLRSCFVWGELHADPHSGNFRFSRPGGQASVGVLDFGCVKTLGTRERDGLRRLVQDAEHLNGEELLNAYIAAGFNPVLLEPIAPRLRAVTTVLFEPFYAEGPYDPRGWRLSERLAGVLGEDRWNFRFAGPASLLFLVRAFQGLVHHIHRLEAVLDWKRELASMHTTPPSIDECRHDVQSIAPRLAGDLSSMAATSLRLRVVRHGEQVVQLSFAAAAAAHLQDLVPAEFQERVARRGIDLGDLSERVVAGGYQPGELFVLDDDDTAVRAWLE
jgi:predicted unusual protein kinase regulating ubiquinone biosynthesis (AarF/ABC1/UbiB family)